MTRPSNPDGDPTLVRDAAYYDRVYRSSCETWSPAAAERHIWRPAMQFVSAPPIADIGCGPGHFAQLFDDRRDDYCIGVDTSPVAIEQAQRRAPWARFEVGSVDVALNQSGWRTAVLLEVLEHVVDDLGMLTALPSGTPVVASVPTFYTEGHVRWFANVDEVVARYSRVMSVHDVSVERLRLRARGPVVTRFFVFHGTVGA